MNFVQVNIIDSYWRNTGTELYESSRKLRFSGVFEIEIEIEEFEKRLIELILHNKGDGIKVERNSFHKHHIIDVLIFDGEGSVEKHNINYILEYIGKFQESNYSFNIDKNNNYDKLIYFEYRSDETLDETLNELITSLKNNGISAEVICQSKHRFERGASSLLFTIIIGIVTGVVANTISEIIKNILHKHKNKCYIFRPKVANLNIDQLRKNLAKVASVNEKEFIIISFTKSEASKEIYKVTLRTSFEKFEVLSDANGKIHNFSRRDIRFEPVDDLIKI